ncbi:unnamed protein product [Prorocentrum cordatum]|uniref:Chloride channel protein n=1 Tax=Prorocentrum cordatum TaxID=2364126 RepID=A0ABN9SIZ6_9DINO|nr:unnamed protein product [Polarella glacialis]
MYGSSRPRARRPTAGGGDGPRWRPAGAPAAAGPAMDAPAGGDLGVPLGRAGGGGAGERPGPPEARRERSFVQSLWERRGSLSLSGIMETWALGPQTHRLPFRVMWGTNVLTALCVAGANFGMVLLVGALVDLKFSLMSSGFGHSAATGVLVLTVVSTAYAAVGVCLIQFIAPSCGGSGIPENKTYLNGGAMPGLFTTETLCVRIVTNILANAAGFPVGREGPLVTIGSNIAYKISRRLAKPFVRETVELCDQECTQVLLLDEQRMAHANRIACTVGGACAMTVIFNAPIGGLLYMFEEVTSVAWHLELTFRVFASTMCASLVSYGLVSLLGSDMAEFVIYVRGPTVKTWSWADVPVFMLVAALIGVVTSLHTRGMLAVAQIRQRQRATRQRWQPYATIAETCAYAALCALLSTAVSLLGTCTDKGQSGLEYVRLNCHSGTYNPVASLLVATSHSSVKLLFSGNNAGDISASASFLAFATYSTLNVGLAGLPVPGGAFTATMLMGAMLGRSIGSCVHELGYPGAVSGVYAVVGSAAMLCGFKQMTLASVLIVVECVNDLSLAPIVMLGVAISMAVNWKMNRRGHDEEAIARKGLPFLEGEPPHELDRTEARSLCDPTPAGTVLPPRASLQAVRLALGEAEARYFPIREPNEGPWVASSPAAAWKASCRLPRAPCRRPTPRSPPGTTASCGRAALASSAARAGCRSGRSCPRPRSIHIHRFGAQGDTLAPRLYAMFSKAGERAAFVASRQGQVLGIISREGLIAAARRAGA